MIQINQINKGANMNQLNKVKFAFYAPDKTGLWSTYVIKNYWSTTTGKHLNWIDNGNKKERLTTEQFENKYLECFSESIKEVA